ncbi:MAG: alpha/beta fold hydrolase [Deltaproteobacteria bacterium]|nr:alpha/beta fold hydrolase [Deltaproteobacteria bacterium]
MPIPYLEHTVQTPDGWRLTLYRSPPRGPRSLEGGPPPVLLIPGAGANRFTFGVSAGRSLAAILNARGRDVWLAELRGARSARPDARSAAVSLCLKLDLDLPAILAHIREVTGQPRVDLVGHSLGGLLAMLTAGGPHAAEVGRVVTLAAPGTFRGFVGGDAPGPVLRGLARGVEALGARIDQIALAGLARVRGPIPHLVSFQRHFLPGALDVVDRRLYLDHAVEDMPGGDLAQVARWVREGRLVDRLGKDLEARFAAVDHPVLAFASPRDKVVPLALVEAGFRRLGSPDKTLVRVGRDAGHARDYAHADVLLAPSAVVDVLEPLAAWLDGTITAERRGRVPLWREGEPQAL